MASTSSGSSRTVSALPSPTEVSGLLALEATLGDATGHLAVLGVVVAVLDERSCTMGALIEVVLGLTGRQLADRKHRAG